jgi:hypothetical protein
MNINILRECREYWDMCKNYTLNMYEDSIKRLNFDYEKIMNEETHRIEGGKTKDLYPFCNFVKIDTKYDFQDDFEYFKDWLTLCKIIDELESEFKHRNSDTVTLIIRSDRVPKYFAEDRSGAFNEEGIIE